ncbi:MAG TPA: Sec-independent protein translocase protein TatB [Allosphingosinicella sp.]|nr:Sec-independent protein translocase protein TatB [Allosphingosinicella sp.]
MFGIDSAELLIVAIVALVVIGPKDLPKVMRTVGEWIGRARGMAKHFRTGIDTMIRESELEDMEKKWKADNERIMREHPAAAGEDSAAPGTHYPDYVPPVAAPGDHEMQPLPPGDSGRAPPPAPPRRVAPPPRRRTAPPPPRRDLP